MNEYLDLARQGKNDWWRYVLSILLILVMWQILSALPSLFVLAVSVLMGNPVNGASPASALPGVDPLLSFTVLTLASVFFVLGIYLAVRFIHRRPFLTLLTPARSLDWRRLMLGFAVWFGLAGLMSLGEALLYPGRYVLTLDLPRFIPLIFLALILVPIQTSAEEFFFRGYILQGLGLPQAVSPRRAPGPNGVPALSVRIRNIWLLSVVSGLLFMAPHFLNPEASASYLLMGLYYFSMGVFLAYLTLREGRLELALGIHAANNLFSALVANYTVTVMPTPSLFTVNVVDPVYSVPAALLGMAIFVGLFLGPLKREKGNE